MSRWTRDHQIGTRREKLTRAQKELSDLAWVVESIVEVEAAWDGRISIVADPKTSHRTLHNLVGEDLLTAQAAIKSAKDKALLRIGELAVALRVLTRKGQVRKSGEGGKT